MEFLQCCEHPKRITQFDKFTGKEKVLYVPCGKCNSCRNKHSYTLVKKLEDESKCWRYQYFFTLTYSDRYVPTFSLVKNQLINTNTGHVIDCQDYLDSDSKEYIVKRGYKIYIGCLSDVQKFMKRLRYYVTALHESPLNQKLIQKYGKEQTKPFIRYAYNLEYGETTLRPHYHGILYFSSPLTAQNIEEIVHKAWQFGRVDISPVECSCSSYVAAYINSLACLPKIYTHREIRPWLLYSKRPPLGSLVIPEEEVKEIFHCCTPTRSEFRNGEVVYKPLDTWLENRLFPKCHGFGSISFNDRVTMYGISQFFPSEEFEDFSEKIRDYYSSKVLEYGSLSIFHRIYEIFSHLDPHGKRSSLYKLYCISRRVVYQASIFGVSLSEYVGHISEYWKRKDYFNLTSQLQGEIDYLSLPHRSLSDLINVDPNIIEMAEAGIKVDYENVFYSQVSPLWVENILKQFGIDIVRFCTDFSYRESLKALNISSHHSMIKVNADRSRKKMKTKRKNEYLAAHPECANLVYNPNI